MRLHRAEEYITKWEACGYSDGVPDQVPDELMRLNLAPSYKAIAFAILKNDLNFYSLGFPEVQSSWYSFLKKKEFENKKENNQGDLF